MTVKPIGELSIIWVLPFVLKEKFYDITEVLKFEKFFFIIIMWDYYLNYNSYFMRLNFYDILEVLKFKKIFFYCMKLLLKLQFILYEIKSDYYWN